MLAVNTRIPTLNIQSLQVITSTFLTPLEFLLSQASNFFATIKGTTSEHSKLTILGS